MCDDSLKRMAVFLALAGALATAPFGSAPLCAQTPLTEHTISLDEGSELAPASLDEVRWMAGRWRGEGLGATVEETWLPPAGDAMPGVFRLVRDGQVDFYELVTIVEEGGSLIMRLKHFDAELVGWEERAESVTFPLVRHDENTLWFDGLTIERVAPDSMRIWVALESREGGSSEGHFEYRRVERRPPATRPPLDEP